MINNPGKAVISGPEFLLAIKLQKN